MPHQESDPVPVGRSEESERRLAEAVRLARGRLLAFIRRHVRNPQDAEDVLQDVFYELVVAYRLMKPIEHTAAWMFRVARNRLIDEYRRKRVESIHQAAAAGDRLDLESLIPSPDGGPEADFARGVLMKELEHALAELPQEQRSVFLAHEFEGRSFRDLAAEAGVSVNTLLSRKRYAVLHLRRRLQSVYDELSPG